MATQLYGILSGRGFKLLMLPVAVISSINAALLPAVSEANVRYGVNTVKSRVMLGLRFTILFVLPASVGLILLANAVFVMGVYVFATKTQWARMKFVLPPRISAITLMLVAIVVGILVYGLMVVISGIVTKREMQALPMLGKHLVMIFEKMWIY